MCVGVLPAYLSVHHMCAVPVAAGNGQQTLRLPTPIPPHTPPLPFLSRTGGTQDTTWGLGMEPRHSARATSALGHLAASLDP